MGAYAFGSKPGVFFERAFLVTSLNSMSGEVVIAAESLKDVRVAPTFILGAGWPISTLRKLPAFRSTSKILLVTRSLSSDSTGISRTSLYHAHLVVETVHYGRHLVGCRFREEYNPSLIAHGIFFHGFVRFIAG